MPDASSVMFSRADRTRTPFFLSLDLLIALWLERMPVEDLQLPIRIINCLHRNKAVTVAELVQLKDKEIMAMNGIGKTAIKDIRKKQSAYIKELLIELVTNEITEISNRKVVNVLREPV